MDYSGLKAGVYVANPSTGAVKAITDTNSTTFADLFTKTRDASIDTIAANVAWVYSALEIRREKMGEIAYQWELNGQPLENDNDLPFKFNTMEYAQRADKAIQLWGNSYLWKWRKSRSRQIHELRWLDPRCVDIDTNSVEPGIGYTRYWYNEQYKRETIFAPDLIRTYIRGLNELDPDSNAAMAYNLAAQIIWGMQQTTDSFYDTNGLPVMIVKVSPGASPQNRADTQSAFKRIFQRRRDGKGNKVVAVSNDVEITPISFAPKDLAQDSLSTREIRSIYAANNIPFGFLTESGDRARSEQDIRTIVGTMGARFQTLADHLNADEDVQKAGLELRVMVNEHYSMKRDESLASVTVQNFVSSGLTPEAALYLNGISIEDFPDGMTIFASDVQQPETPEQPAQETAVADNSVEEDDADDMREDAVKAELSQLQRFIRKGSHRKRPFKAAHIGREAIKAEITEQEERDAEILASRLQELIEKAARGEIAADEFKEEYLDVFLLALTASAASGAEGDMITAGDARIAEMESQARESVDALSAEIYAGRYSEGGINPLTPDAPPYSAASDGQTAETAVRKVVNRVALWAGQLALAFTVGQVNSEANAEARYMWQVGPTEHCPDCLRLDRQVHTASEWAASGIEPQSPDLFCKGYNCQCRLIEVDANTPVSGGF